MLAPVPVRLTVAPEFDSVRVAEAVIAVKGVNVMLAVHEPLAANVAGGVGQVVDAMEK